MSDWIERTRPTIKFTSPEGNTFEALWRSNNTPQEKKIGIFNYPQVLGSVVQDLGVNSTRYPIIIYFDGPDNDLQAQRFQVAFNETGPWTVIHPMLGEKILQPISFSPDFNPTTSGNVTIFTTEWIEPISDEVITSLQELEARIQEQQVILNAQNNNQLVENISQVNPGETIAITEESNNILTVFNETMDGLSQLNSDIYNEVVGIKGAIENTIIQPIIDVQSLGGQFQQLIELPFLVLSDFESRINPLVNFIDGLLTGIDEIENTEIGKNIISVKENILVSTLLSLGTIAITSDFQTRSQSIQAIEDINNIFNIITNSLDTAQNNFLNNSIDNQYFSQTQNTLKFLH